MKHEKKKKWTMCSKSPISIQSTSKSHLPQVSSNLENQEAETESVPCNDAVVVIQYCLFVLPPSLVVHQCTKEIWMLSWKQIHHESSNFKHHWISLNYSVISWFWGVTGMTTSSFMPLPFPRGDHSVALVQLCSKEPPDLGMDLFVASIINIGYVSC